MTPRPVEVTLCWSEMVFCALAGALFQIQNLRHGTRDKHLGSRSELEHPWELHIEAAMTELLVARHLGTYWIRPHALGDKTAMDGVGYEVRGTPRADGHLIIHEPDKSNDRPETPFVLVTGRPPTFTPTNATHGAPPAVRGWTPCRSAPVPWNREERDEAATMSDRGWKAFERRLATPSA